MAGAGELISWEGRWHPSHEAGSPFFEIDIEVRFVDLDIIASQTRVLLFLTLSLTLFLTCNGVKSQSCDFSSENLIVFSMEWGQETDWDGNGLFQNKGIRPCRERNYFAKEIIQYPIKLTFPIHLAIGKTWVVDVFIKAYLAENSN